MLRNNGSKRIAAAMGCALLLWTFGIGYYVAALNYPKEQLYQPYRYAADKSFEIDPAAARLPNANPIEYRSPCNNPKGHNESDLCAQWRAAKAAEKSAFWTKCGFGAAILGSSLLMWQIALTRRAVQDTARATEAMNRQNELTDQAQRPWIEISVEFDFIAKTEHGFIISVYAILGNIGKTPAYHADIYHFLAPPFKNPIKDHNPIGGFKILSDVPHKEVRNYRSDLIVLPGGRAQDQQLIVLEKSDPRHPADGVVLQFMISVHYQLPDGREAQSSAWFVAGVPSLPEAYGIIPWDWDPGGTELLFEARGYIKAT